MGVLRRLRGSRIASGSKKSTPRPSWKRPARRRGRAIWFFVPEPGRAVRARHLKPSISGEHRRPVCLRRPGRGDWWPRLGWMQPARRVWPPRRFLKTSPSRVVVFHSIEIPGTRVPKDGAVLSPVFPECGAPRSVLWRGLHRPAICRGGSKPSTGGDGISPPRGRSMRLEADRVRRSGRSR